MKKRPAAPKSAVSKSAASKSSIAARISSFYGKYPYPSQRVESIGDLTGGEHARVMRKILATAGLTPDELRGMRVLDAGCGTGEKSIYCALFGAHVDGFDISKTSIEIAGKNAAKLGVRDARFRVADFASVKLNYRFDFILAMGSLHHSEEPKGNFMRLCGSLKKNGRIALGLYNLYGRLACRMRRRMMRVGAESEEDIVRRLPPARSPTHLASLADRYATPHESYHTVEEVMGWFGEAGIEPIGTDPQTNIHSRADTLFKQLSWMGKEKGFFYMGGKKK